MKRFFVGLSGGSELVDCHLVYDSDINFFYWAKSNWEFDFTASYTLAEIECHLKVGHLKEIINPQVKTILEVKPLTAQSLDIYPEFPRTEDNFIRTYTGKKFWPLSPRVEDVDILDITHALSMKCRFGGMTHKFYSVAQHSVLVSQLVPPAYAFIALMHDAAEAYMPDVATPVKRAIPLFKKMEERIEAVIRTKFRLPEGKIVEVKAADEQAMRMEGTRFIEGFEKYESTGGLLTDPLLPSSADSLFWNRFIALAGSSGQYRAAA